MVKILDSKSILKLSDPWRIAFITLILLYLLPIWVFRYFPTQDGPCHIYNSFILKHYNDPDYVFNEYYDIRKEPIPNWASHVIMFLLMYVVPPLIAEKLLLTGYVIFMALSILYFINSEENKRIPLAFIGFPFIYNYLFLMGFYNFSLGLALFLLTIGYWWRHFNSFQVKDAFVLGSILVLLYFCHPFPLFLSLFSIGLMSILSLFPRFSNWKKTLLSFFSMLPSAGLGAYYIISKGTEQSPGGWKIERLWQYFIRNESLAYHSENQLIFGKIISGIFFALFIYTIIREHFFTREWRFGFRICRRDFFVLLCLAFFVLYLKAPDGFSKGGFIKTRFALFPFLIIIPYLSFNMPKLTRAIVGCLIMILSASYILQVGYYHKDMNNEIKIYNSGFNAVEKNKVILPLCFDYVSKSWRIGVFTHTLGYYGYETGCINLINYEAGTNYFPTIFKPSFHRPSIAEVHVGQNEIDFAKYKDDIHYILTWSMVPGSHVEKRILQYYNLIMENEKLKIFKRN